MAALGTLSTRRGGVTSTWHRLLRFRMAYLFLLPALILLVFVDFVPMVQGIGTSLFSWDMFQPGARPFVGLQQYRNVFANPLFEQALWQSVEFTIAAVICQLLVGMAAAVLLNQAARFRSVFRGLVLIPWVVPGTLTAMMFALLFTSNGLVNTLMSSLGLVRLGIVPAAYPWLSHASTAMPVLILTDTWKGFPFFCVMFLAAMQTIPRDLYEAARVDGAGGWRCFRHVTLPGIGLTVFIATLFGMIWTFNTFDLIYVMTDGGPYYSTTTLVTLAYQQAFGQGLVSYASAISVLILIVVGAMTGFYFTLYRRVAEAA